MISLGWLIPVVLSGVAVFVSTNIDDLFLLMLLFSQFEKTFKKQHIVIGQYLGFVIIIAVSTLGFFGRLVAPIPLEWLGFLGFIPVAMGIRGIIKLFRSQKLTSEVSEEVKYFQSIKSHSLAYKVFAPLLSPQTYIVTAMTVGNGTDNISSYIPLFANGSFLNMCVLIGLFLLLAGIWCYIGYVVVHLPPVARAINLYGHLLLPFLFLFVGIFVMYQSGTLRLLSLIVVKIVYILISTFHKFLTNLDRKLFYIVEL